MVNLGQGFCGECGNTFERHCVSHRWCSKKCTDKVAGRKRDRARDQEPERVAAKKQTARNWRAKKVADGLCIRCGKITPSDGNRTCSLCIEDIGNYKGH